ncbi:MAG: 50S ribosomal protein L4 [Phycisphaerae bacterium]
MIEVPVYNEQGQQVSTMKVEESTFGTVVRRKLLKQAVVMYESNKRQGTVATKSRGMVAGSTRKLYAQKHTGRARMGTIRTNIRRGGGVAFAKVPKDWTLRLPAKAKKLARDSAILAKLQDGQVMIIDKMGAGEPKTKYISGILKALKIDRTCLIGIKEYDKNVYLSVRNLSDVAVMPVNEFNAYDVLKYSKILVTRDGFEKLVQSNAILD